MPTREIEPSEWIRFCDSFSREHVGAMVTVEILGDAIGSQVEASNLSFDGISADPGERTISVGVGQSTDRHLIHIVNRAKRILVEQGEAGMDEALEIESDDGPTTLVRFSRSH